MNAGGHSLVLGGVDMGLDVGSHVHQPPHGTHGNGEFLCLVINMESTLVGWGLFVQAPGEYHRVQIRRGHSLVAAQKYIVPPLEDRRQVTPAVAMSVIRLKAVYYSSANTK